MTIESVTYISDFNTANPASGDSRTEGDDHIRNIKVGIKGTFPNFAGAAMTCTEAELNVLDGISAGQATASKAVVLDANKDFNFGTGDVTCTNLTVSGAFTGSAGTLSGNMQCVTLTATTSVVTDTISEHSAGHGVAVDGLVLKDAGFAIGSDANGDMYYRGSGALARLGKGTAYQQLRMNAGATAPEWGGGCRYSAALTFGTAGLTPATVYTPLAHGLGAQPVGCTGYIECLSTDAGYSAGDRLPWSSSYGVSNVGMSFVADATTIGCNLDALGAVSNSTGSVVGLDETKWKAVIYGFIIV